MERKQCLAPACRKTANPKSSHCNTCRNQIEKDRDLARWAYRKLKNNAKRRGKEFNLTLEEFRRFCVTTEVLLGRGRHTHSLHIDRKDDSLGYTLNNIQPLSNRENIRKENQRHKRKIYDYELAARRRHNAYETAEDAASEAGLSEFRFVDVTEKPNDYPLPPF